jgi:hypothetical protein
LVDITCRPLYLRKRAVEIVEWEVGRNPDLAAFLRRENAAVCAGDRIPENPACILVSVQNKLSGFVVLSQEVLL